MLTLIKTDSSNPDFINLVKELDIYLAEVDGDDHAFYDQFNKIESLKYVIVAYEDSNAVGCGAMKEIMPGIMEMKRMYTSPLHRGKGIASAILYALEKEVKKMNMKKCLLETGIRQAEAISLYKKLGYHLTENYGQYAGVKTSLCFEKKLQSSDHTFQDLEF